MRNAWCVSCCQWKSLIDFSPKSYWPDGSYRLVLSRCKACLAKQKRERRRADPGWARKTDRRDWERIQADPVKAARRRELQRENSQVFRVKQRGGV